VGWNPRPCQQLFNPGLQKNQWALSVRVIVICSGHGLLLQDSNKGFDHASTLPESIRTPITMIMFGVARALDCIETSDYVWQFCLVKNNEGVEMENFKHFAMGFNALSKKQLRLQLFFVYFHKKNVTEFPKIESFIVRSLDHIFKKWEVHWKKTYFFQFFDEPYGQHSLSLMTTHLLLITN